MVEAARVLIVEDSPDEAELIAHQLRKADFPFTWRRVETENALRAALGDFLPTVILSDFSLPQFDGVSALLRTLRIPTLVITGDHDFIPVEVAEHIARAIPNAELITIKDCGHFAYLECPNEVRNLINDFFRRTRPTQRQH